MIISIRTILVFCLLLFFTSCQQYKLDLFSSISQKDTLKIQVEMSECGEWGGHREHIYIYRNNANDLYATYQRDTIQCGNRISMFGVPYDRLRFVVFDTTVIFKRESENEMKSFIRRIFRLKLKGQIPIANYGDRYRISRTDSTFIIEYNNIANRKNTRFKNLKRTLFGNI